MDMVILWPLRSLREYYGVYMGRIQDFHLGGGGEKDYVRSRTHTMSEKPEVPYGRGPGTLKGPGSSRGFWCSLVLSEPYF